MQNMIDEYLDSMSELMADLKQQFPDNHNEVWGMLVIPAAITQFTHIQEILDNDPNAGNSIENVEKILESVRFLGMGQIGYISTYYSVVDTENSQLMTEISNCSTYAAEVMFKYYAYTRELPPPVEYSETSSRPRVNSPEIWWSDIMAPETPIIASNYNPNSSSKEMLRALLGDQHETFMAKYGAASVLPEDIETAEISDALFEPRWNKSKRKLFRRIK